MDVPFVLLDKFHHRFQFFEGIFFPEFHYGRVSDQKGLYSASFCSTLSCVKTIDSKVVCLYL